MKIGKTKPVQKKVNLSKNTKRFGRIHLVIFVAVFASFGGAYLLFKSQAAVILKNGDFFIINPTSGTQLGGASPDCGHEFLYNPATNTRNCIDKKSYHRPKSISPNNQVVFYESFSTGRADYALKSRSGSYITIPSELFAEPGEVQFSSSISKYPYVYESYWSDNSAKLVVLAETTAAGQDPLVISNWKNYVVEIDVAAILAGAVPASNNVVRSSNLSSLVPDTVKNSFRIRSASNRYPDLNLSVTNQGIVAVSARSAYVPTGILTGKTTQLAYKADAPTVDSNLNIHSKQRYSAKYTYVQYKDNKTYIGVLDYNQPSSKTELYTLKFDATQQETLKGSVQLSPNGAFVLFHVRTTTGGVVKEELRSVNVKTKAINNINITEAASQGNFQLYDWLPKSL